MSRFSEGNHSGLDITIAHDRHQRTLPLNNIVLIIDKAIVIHTHLIADGKIPPT